MIDDVRPATSRERQKPKIIQPLPKEPQTPLPVLDTPEDSSSTLLKPTVMIAGPAAKKSSFKTPEQVAATEEAAAAPLVGGRSGKGRGSGKLAFLRPPYSRKQRIIGSAIIVVLAISIGAGWTLTHHKRAAIAGAPQKSIVKKTIPPTPIYSTLSGLQITDASLNQKPVTAVMVENSIDARPQSGLGDAGVVFEAIAEGGVTRFMALFQDKTPTDVGPIRSARPYYVQWALGFDAAYAHVGGSPDALNDIKTWGVHDMNQFYNAGYFHRVTSRAAPHNVYTGIDTLNQLEAKDGYTSTFTGFARKDDQPYKAPTQPSNGSKPLTNQPVVTPANSIDFKLSGPTYDPHYDYDPSANTYKRSEAGAAHTDANTNTQLSPKVVVAMVVPLGRGALDSSGAYYSDYNPIGTGAAYFFQDGTVVQGKWSKPDNSGALTFTDTNGTPFTLNRGQTWITAVSSTSGVVYK
ncbi:MAG TPA: DUF3048 domain-containing protein [Candidatus Saccharimonadales bacterium]|nr:DUF3048 domain-containing protein [Candidatus Saccharimonadales bacterium]